MSKLFHPEGKFAQYGGKLADLMWLNLLVLLCVLPVLTAGASFCAMHYVLVKLHRGEEVLVTKAFFKSLRGNLKQSLALSVIFSAFCYLLAVGIRFVYTSQTFPLGHVVQFKLLSIIPLFELVPLRGNQATKLIIYLYFSSHIRLE